MTMKREKKSPNEPLRQRLRTLGFHGLVAAWEEYGQEPWLPGLVQCEETERRRRSLERRQANAHIGRFKPMADFDWTWPDSIDRVATTELFQLGFLDDATNVVLVGPNGTGKSMIAQSGGLRSHGALRQRERATQRLGLPGRHDRSAQAPEAVLSASAPGH